MSRQATKILHKVLEGAETLNRKDAIRLLNYLGFQHRYSNSTHDHWVHNDSGSIFQCTRKKVSQPLWGYQMSDFRKAVNSAVESSKQAEVTVLSKKVEGASDTMFKNGPERIRIPKATAVQLTTPQKPAEPTPVVSIKESNPTAQIIRLNKDNFPDAVAQLVQGFENGEIKGRELARLLTESGYRNSVGSEYTAQTVTAGLVQSKMYKVWKSKNKNRPKPVETLAEAKDVSVQVVTSVEKPAEQSVAQESDPFDGPQMSVDQLFQTINRLVTENKELSQLRAENKKLTEENDALIAEKNALQERLKAIQSILGLGGDQI